MAYVTVLEADAYLNSQIGADAYNNASLTDKENALNSATIALDSYSYTGQAISPTQEFAFPRNGYYFEPKLGYIVQFDPLLIPDRIKKATCEMALHLLNNKGSAGDTGSVKSLKVGSITLTDIKYSNQSSTSNVTNLIRPLLSSVPGNSGNNLWWRAN